LWRRGEREVAFPSEKERLLWDRDGKRRHRPPANPLRQCLAHANMGVRSGAARRRRLCPWPVRSAGCIDLVLFRGFIKPCLVPFDRCGRDRVHVVGSQRQRSYTGPATVRYHYHYLTSYPSVQCSAVQCRAGWLSACLLFHASSPRCMRAGGDSSRRPGS
jgi:hypothetical protein